MLRPPMPDHPAVAKAAPLLLVVNPTAGSGRAATAAARLAAALTALGVPFERRDTAAAGQARAFAAAAPGLVVAVGGDGTVHEVVDGLPLRDGRLGPFAVLPAGSGDDFAGALGGPREPEALAAALAQVGAAGPVGWREIDVGQARFHTGEGVVARRFVNLAGLGFLAEVAAAAQGSRWRGRLRYTLATVAALRRLRSFAVREVAAEGAGAAARCVFVHVANGPRCGGGLTMAPMAEFGDGRLECVRVGEVGRLGLLGLLGKLLVGRHLGDRRVWHGTRAGFALELEEPVAAMVDGEVVARDVQRAEFGCGALRMGVLGALPGR
jgi:diacylglycerol kinase (ATP)